MTVKLADILKDRVSGASDLYRQALKLFITNTRYHQPAQIHKALDRLIEQFPEMAVFVYLKNHLDGVSRKGLVLTMSKLVEEADEELESIGMYLDRFWNRPRRIVTYSQSSVVAAALLERTNLIDSVLISVGSPREEGVEAAKKFAAKGIPVELSTDAALPGLIEKGDFLFLGADCVTEKYFVNKVGSLSLALVAREIGALSFVLYERYKKVNASRFGYHPRSHPAAEIFSRSRKNLSVVNSYFERIPSRHIDWFISGAGPLRGSDLSRAAMVAARSG